MHLYIKHKIYNGLIIFCSILLFGCTASVRESHYFVTSKRVNDETIPVNFFRVDVKADSQMSNARYISGFYDENAVNLFFSEVGSGKDQSKDFFPLEKNTTTDSKNNTTSSIDPKENGAFVMIMSTNADAIAGSIEAFADNETANKSIFEIFNAKTSKELLTSDAELSAKKAKAVAFYGALDNLVTLSKNEVDLKKKKEYYLKIANFLSMEMGGDGNFKTSEAAEAWFSHN